MIVQVSNHMLYCISPMKNYDWFPSVCIKSSAKMNDRYREEYTALYREGDRDLKPGYS